MDLVERIYKITSTFPKLYGLTAQLRRSAVSVASNIAEGHGRSGIREFIHHLSIAHGSLSELETQMDIALRLKYVAEADHQSFAEISSETGRLVNGLMNALKKHTRT